MKSNLSEIGFNVEMINKMVAGLEGKIELLESKQDVGAKLAIDSAVKFEEKSVKGLQFLTETNESAPSQKPTVDPDKTDVDSPVKKVPTMKTKDHNISFIVR
ncbi:Phenylalanine--tRNA ligase beta subunit [Gossypium australe]|uniref:Phenylalanine--tRNA ligase beta subunit n=1 Tax=Gossypium australe TaxID=47621 RepID=A0A5B6VYI6_9ROSI|nr:Phenylalanine--tRNA ligase beta subunit [Gossypium australe]